MRERSRVFENCLPPGLWFQKKGGTQLVTFVYLAVFPCTRDKAIFVFNAQQPSLLLGRSVLSQSIHRVFHRQWWSEPQVLFLVSTRLRPQLLAGLSFILLSTMWGKKITTMGPGTQLPTVVSATMHTWPRMGGMLHPLIPSTDKSTFTLNSQQPSVLPERTVISRSSKTVSHRQWQVEPQVLFLVRSRLPPHLLPGRSFTLLLPNGGRKISTTGPCIHFSTLENATKHIQSRMGANLHPLTSATMLS
ncbi:hypothetical protein V6N13_051398 [Hibiscus sabdariffa]